MAKSKKLVSDCCGADFEPYFSFRMEDEGWYCTECGESCQPVEAREEGDENSSI